jgi:hypothetical protein
MEGLADLSALHRELATEVDQGMANSAVVDGDGGDDEVPGGPRPRGTEIEVPGLIGEAVPHSHAQLILR